MTPDAIQEEYNRLCYQLGWSFMMTKEARLYDAPVCLVGLNPGGGHSGAGIWSCERGNAYHCEKWGKPRRGSEQDGEAYSRLQRQVHHMEKALGLDPESYFAAQFVPFRSEDWKRLGNSAQAVAFGQKLWTWVLGRSPVKRFLCLGNLAASHVAKLVGCTEAERLYPTDYGKVTIGRQVGTCGRVVIRLPHLSRHGIFGRADGHSAVAVASLEEAFQPAV